MARFYTNENFRLSIVLELRKLGNDVLTSLEAGNANQSIPDEKVLEFSISENRILITFNRRDFIQLHNSKSEHSGIIVCTDDPDAARIAKKIHDAVLDKGLENQLVGIHRDSI